jgi:hypothetical protein
MNVNRMISLTAAIVISAIQWAAFLSPGLHTQSLRAVGVPVVADASDGP